MKQPLNRFCPSLEPNDAVPKLKFANKLASSSWSKQFAWIEANRLNFRESAAGNLLTPYSDSVPNSALSQLSEGRPIRRVRLFNHLVQSCYNCTVAFTLQRRPFVESTLSRVIWVLSVAWDFFKLRSTKSNWAYFSISPKPKFCQI